MSLFTYPINLKYISVFLILQLPVLSAITQGTHINDSIVTFLTTTNPNQTIKNIDLSHLTFHKALNNNINFGIVGNEYKYILLKLTSPHISKEQYLSIDNTSLDTITLYRIYNNGAAQLLYQGGNLVALKHQRNYVWHTVQVEISETPSFYFIALKSPEKNINLRYEILDRADLQKKYQSYDRIVFAYIGIISLITVVILFAFFLFKRRVFIIYLGYVLSLCGWILSHYGYLFPLAYPNLPVINEIIKPVTSLAASFFLIVVLSAVFKKELELLYWLRRLIKCTQYILLALIGLVLLLLIPSLSTLAKAILINAWHIMLVFSICVIALIPLRFTSTSVTARIFFLAMLSICIMAIVQLIANAGFIHNFFIKEHGMAIGSLLEISIMAFGLFYGLLEEKKQKDREMLALEQEHTETLKKLITVQDTERKRIAGDLHDNIGPLLAALKINFRRIVNVKGGDHQHELVVKTESIIDDSITEIRNIAHNLMPKGLSSKGLISALTDYFAGIQQLYDSKITFDHQITSIFHPDLQINIYRIICELVLNAAKHSSARLVTVHIITDEERISISIQDDGEGFQTKSGDQKESLGLQSAENRVLYLKGNFNLKTAPCKGVMIDIEIPL